MMTIGRGHWICPKNSVLSKIKNDAMATTIKNPAVDAYLQKANRWRVEFEALRDILCTMELAEEIKWKNPCYVLDNANIVLIHGFKDYCALLFFKGALMQDPKGILIQQTDNVQAARQIRFTSLEQILHMEETLKAYVREAVRVERAGLKVVFKKETEFACPEEFQDKLDENLDLEKAFKALTPGRQRAYLLYFSTPKQSATRASRVEKSLSRILDGKGLDD